MKLSLAFSSCPNDTFMFHAMTHGLVDTSGLEFEVEVYDVEQLNHSALKGTYDISKLSYHGYFNVIDSYRMLDSGSALGWGCGPLLVCAQGNEGIVARDDIKVAVPGTYTTGALLYSMAFPGKGTQIPMLFSEIEGAVQRGEADMGVLIHEGRFTYRSKGLALVRDLGQWWQETTQCPIPLGGIAVRRSLGEEIFCKLERILHASIEYAFAHPEASRDFVASFARELSPDIQKKHIDMFVNDYSLSLGEEGRRAVDELYSLWKSSGSRK